MDSGRRLLFLQFILILISLMTMICMVNGNNVVFKVHHKYGGGRGRGKAFPLGAMVAHDSHRHGRMLSALDFELGGDGSPTSAALYYTQIKIGTPPVEYHVQVDTGSDILWVNCKNCDKCPTKSSLDIPLKQYDLSASSSGKTVSCDTPFCESVFSSSSCQAGMSCMYSITYGDGSKTEGNFIRDEFTLDQVTGNLQTSAMNGSIAFGCSSKQSGDLGQSSQAVDGIIGFGQANTSILSQLALSGKVKKVFSHCLDGNRGGGIFAIGEVVEPKINKTPLVPDMPHYNVILRSVEVGGQSLDLPFDLFDLVSNRGTVIDSGTTLAYLPPDLYNQLMTKMMAQQPDLQLHEVEGSFKCFWFNGNVNDGFPVVRFNFKGGLSLFVYPNEYLFEVHDNEYCIGWQSSQIQARDGRALTLLGDIVLQDKLVVYDLDNMTIGWAQHNCSSSIKVKDEASGNAYDVGAHDISSHSSLTNRVNVGSFVLFIAVIFHLIE